MTLQNLLNALAKITSSAETSGPGVMPTLELHFDTLEDLRAASDAIRAARSSLAAHAIAEAHRQRAADRARNPDPNPPTGSLE